MVRRHRFVNDVILGLDKCRDKDRGCEGCPYFGDTDCENNLVEDAMFRLQHQSLTIQRLELELDLIRAERDKLREKLPRESKNKGVWRRIKEKENGKTD